MDSIFDQIARFSRKTGDGSLNKGKTYYVRVRTYRTVESKKKMVNDSHLLSEDKEYLTMLWDDIWEKARRGEYTNYELDANGNRSIGLFGTGFLSFNRKTTDAHAQAFIKMEGRLCHG